MLAWMVGPLIYYTMTNNQLSSWILYAAGMAVVLPPIIWTFGILPLQVIREFHQIERPFPENARLYIVIYVLFPCLVSISFFTLSCVDLMAALEVGLLADEPFGTESLIFALIVVACSLFFARKVLRLSRVNPIDLDICPICGYDLRNLSEKGCPECGWYR